MIVLGLIALYIITMLFLGALKGLWEMAPIFFTEQKPAAPQVKREQTRQELIEELRRLA